MDQAIRYFDTAPFYGAGLAEIRLGDMLSGKNRNEYVISTKVGRIVLDEVVCGAQTFGEKGTVFQHGRKNTVVTDYTADATLRSLEDSLKRLRTDRVEIVWYTMSHRIFMATSGWPVSTKRAEARSGR